MKKEETPFRRKIQESFSNFFSDRAIFENLRMGRIKVFGFCVLKRAFPKRKKRLF